MLFVELIYVGIVDLSVMMLMEIEYKVYVVSNIYYDIFQFVICIWCLYEYNFYYSLFV